MEEADAELAAQNAKETDNRIPTVDLELSTMTAIFNSNWKLRDALG